MWSHYGNSHSGLAIKYNSKNLLSSLTMKDVKEPVFSILNYLDYNKYCDNNNIIKNPNNLKPILVNYINALTKSDVWEYENEWRLIFQLKKSINNERKKFYWNNPNGKNTIEEIIFGRYFFKNTIKSKYIKLENGSIRINIADIFFPNDKNCSSDHLNKEKVKLFFEYLIENRIVTSVIMCFSCITPKKVGFNIRKKDNYYTIIPSVDFLNRYTNPIEEFYTNLISEISIIC